MLRSGSAPISSPMNARTPSGASTSTWPRTFSRPPSAHSATARIEIACVDRLEVAARDGLRLARREMRLRVAAACCMFAATSCTLVLASLAALPIGHAASFTPLNRP